MRHQRGVLNLLLRRLPTRADAEDVAQETFLMAWRGIERYDPSRRFTTWLYTIAVRASVDVLRRTRAHEAVDERDERLVDAGPDPAAWASSREEARALWALADRALSPDQRTALWLRYAEDADAAEIGRVLGRTALAVRLLLHRARRILGDRLAAGRASALPETALPSGAEAIDHA